MQLPRGSFKSCVRNLALVLAFLVAWHRLKPQITVKEAKRSYYKVLYYGTTTRHNRAQCFCNTVVVFLVVACCDYNSFEINSIHSIQFDDFVVDPRSGYTNYDVQTRGNSYRAQVREKGRVDEEEEALFEDLVQEEAGRTVPGNWHESRIVVYNRVPKTGKGLCANRTREQCFQLTTCVCLCCAGSMGSLFLMERVAKLHSYRVLPIRLPKFPDPYFRSLSRYVPT